VGRKGTAWRTQIILTDYASQPQATLLGRIEETRKAIGRLQQQCSSYLYPGTGGPFRFNPGGWVLGHFGEYVSSRD
jgi:hypothetical protein